MTVEDTWRFIPIAGACVRPRPALCLLASPLRGMRMPMQLCLPRPALPPAVFLGLLILLAAACALLGWRLTWPRTTAACTALLWLDVALLMLLGAGGFPVPCGLPHGRPTCGPAGFAGWGGDGRHPTADAPPPMCALLQASCAAPTWEPLILASMRRPWLLRSPTEQWKTPGSGSRRASLAAWRDMAGGGVQAASTTACCDVRCCAACRSWQLSSTTWAFATSPTRGWWMSFLACPPICSMPWQRQVALLLAPRLLPPPTAAAAAAAAAQA